MSRWYSLRRLVTVAGLVFAWCALWGEPSLANIASGVVVATLVSGRRSGASGRGRIRVRPLLRFGALVVVDLVMATAGVAKEILTPADSTEEAIVAVSVPTDSRAHLLPLIVAITVTPGTAVVDVDADTGTLYLHLLHAERRSAIEEHVRELADLASRAFPAPRSLSSPSRP